MINVFATFDLVFFVNDKKRQHLNQPKDGYRSSGNTTEDIDSKQIETIISLQQNPKINAFQMISFRQENVGQKK